MTRELLGRTRGLGGTVKTYRKDGAFEMDEIEGTHGTRRRIFFDDVILVSYHRERGARFLWGSGLPALFLLSFGARMLMDDPFEKPAALMLLSIGTPFLILFIIRLVLQVDVITICGRHGRARLDFEFRKAKAREVHQRICRDVRTAQGNLRRLAPRPAVMPPAAEPGAVPEVEPSERS